jgi:hypothetical protein
MAAHCTAARQHYQEVGDSAKQSDYLTRKIKEENFILK